MNGLKEKYDLVDLPRLDPVEQFWKSPSPWALRRVPKRLQTTEIIDAAIDRYKGDRVFLKYASGRALTDEQRKRIVSIQGDELRFISKRYITAELVQAAVDNNWRALKDVPDALKTKELCETAILQDGQSLSLIPESMRTFEFCLKAVKNDHSRNDYSLALEVVPEAIIFGPNGRDLCTEAVNANGLALKAVPSAYIDSKLVWLAVEHDPYGWMCSAIQFVPADFVNERLVDLSLKVNPASIGDLPPSARKYVTEDKCIEHLRENPGCIGRVPDSLLARKSVADFALEQSPQALRYLPDKTKTKARCFAAKERDPEGVLLSWFPERVRERWEATHPSEDDRPDSLIPFALLAERKRLPLPVGLLGHGLVVGDVGRLVPHQLSDALSCLKTFCYISDVHLEHQIAFEKCETMAEARGLVKEKVSELVSSLPIETAYVLLAGDIADSVGLAKLFYESLVDELDERRLRPTIVSVLGNHELWDACPSDGDNCSVNQIIEKYRKALGTACERSGRIVGVVLENSLLVLHKGVRARVIHEEDIIQSGSDELKELCDESTVLVLGGLGCSGLNPKFNAGMGLYRGAVSSEEDVALSERFRAVHDKLVQCAGEKRVVVLTHSPVQNWLPHPPNNNWVYINGHTHLNGLELGQGGPTLLFDNQIGYEPKTWHFNSVVLDAGYDPFESWEDGVYEITPEQYREFNRGRGIYSEFNRAGALRVAKREGLYMFFLENGGKAYRLEGGRIYLIDHRIAWYYNNIPRYAMRVQRAFEPYQRALRMISEEVRSFGGYGMVHGCIVDIDFFNHIYLDPFTGVVTPYFAWDTEEREEFNSVGELLATRSILAGTLEQDDMLQAYDEQERLGNLTLLSDKHIKVRYNDSIVVPKEVLDRSMYEPSRIMRSIQYLFDGNVIRIWRDSVLSGDAGPVEHIAAEKPMRLSGSKLLSTSETQ